MDNYSPSGGLLVLDVVTGGRLSVHNDSLFHNQDESSSGVGTCN